MEMGKQACFDLYQNVKASPSTTTCAVLSKELNVSISGLLPGASKLLAAFDLNTGQQLVIKVLKFPNAEQQMLVEQEVAACCKVRICCCFASYHVHTHQNTSFTRTRRGKQVIR